MNLHPGKFEVYHLHAHTKGILFFSTKKYKIISPYSNYVKTPINTVSYEMIPQYTAIPTLLSVHCLSKMFIPELMEKPIAHQ